MKDSYLTRELNAAAWIVMRMRQQYGELWKKRVDVRLQSPTSTKSEFEFQDRSDCLRFVAEYTEYKEALDALRDIVYTHE